MRNPRLLLYAALILAVLNLARKVEPPRQLPLVKADYQMCARVSPGPIARPDHYGKPYQRKPDVA